MLLILFYTIPYIIVCKQHILLVFRAQWYIEYDPIQIIIIIVYNRPTETVLT